MAFTQQQLLQNPQDRTGLGYTQLSADGLNQTQAENALLGYGGQYQYSQNPATQGAQAWDQSQGWSTNAQGNIIGANGNAPTQLYQILQSQGLTIDNTTGQIVPIPAQQATTNTGQPPITSLGTGANGQMPQTALDAAAGIQTPYTPQYQGYSDTTLAQIIQGLSNPSNNVAGQLQPGITANAQAIATSPLAGADVGAAQTSGQALTQQGNQAIGNANTLSTNANSLSPDIASVLSAAFDPQSALYAQTLQQTQDQTRAGLEARGLDMSPVGAQIEGQNLNNFNIDWQNNLLNRMGQGATTAEGLLGAQGTGQTQANALGTSGAGNIASGGALPYTTQTGINTNNINALTSAATAGNNSQNLPTTAAGLLQNYLKQGTAATTVNNTSQDALIQALSSAGGAAGGLASLLGGSGLGGAASGLASSGLSGLESLLGIDQGSTVDGGVDPTNTTTLQNILQAFGLGG